MYLILDQGTSSSKVFLFDNEQKVRFTRRLPHRLIRPAAGHAESDPLLILESCYHLIKEALDFSKKAGGTIDSAGLAVQRSTFLFWDKKTAKPLTPAISWQDTRSEEETNSLKESAEFIQYRTGTPLSAHFGGPKYMHMVSRDKDLANRAAAGSAYFGPLSAFLSQSLTGVPGVDHSIAGRSLCMNLDEARWDQELCELFSVNMTALPPLLPTLADYGEITIDGDKIPLRCVIGDQQAALLGQGGWESGDVALNFGTSGSVMLNSGENPGHIPGLVGSMLYSLEGKRNYLLEGTINSCNSLFDWLENDMNIPVHRRKWDIICQNTKTDGIIVPGYCGIAAPYWTDRIETVIRNIDSMDPDQMIRAAIESIGFFTNDIINLIRRNLNLRLHTITASGGLSRESLLQFIADLLNSEVRHTRMRDHTALGVYNLLRYADRDSLPGQDFDHVYQPKMSTAERTIKLAEWQTALREAGIVPV